MPGSLLPAWTPTNPQHAPSTARSSAATMRQPPHAHSKTDPTRLSPSGLHTPRTHSYCCQARGVSTRTCMINKMPSGRLTSSRSTHGIQPALFHSCREEHMSPQPQIHVEQAHALFSSLTSSSALLCPQSSPINPFKEPSLLTNAHTVSLEHWFVSKFLRA